MGNTCNKSCCAGCAHFRRLYDGKNGNDLSRAYVCNYILDTGHMRGCSPADCTINRAGRRTGKGAAA